jgi:hypothetical protein
MHTGLTWPVVVHAGRSQSHSCQSELVYLPCPAPPPPPLADTNIPAGKALVHVIGAVRGTSLLFTLPPRPHPTLFMHHALLYHVASHWADGRQHAEHVGRIRRAQLVAGMEGEQQRGPSYRSNCMLCICLERLQIELHCPWNAPAPEGSQKMKYIQYVTALAVHTTPGPACTWPAEHTARHQCGVVSIMHDVY